MPPSEGQQGPGTSTQRRAPLRCSICWELLLDRQRLLDLHFCLPTPPHPRAQSCHPFPFTGVTPNKPFAFLALSQHPFPTEPSLWQLHKEMV